MAPEVLSRDRMDSHPASNPTASRSTGSVIWCVELPVDWQIWHVPENVVILLTTPSESPKTRTRFMSNDLTWNGLPRIPIPPIVTSNLYVPDIQKHSALSNTATLRRNCQGDSFQLKVMPATNAQETCSRNLCKSSCKKLARVSVNLVQVFFLDKFLARNWARLHSSTSRARDKNRATWLAGQLLLCRKLW